MSEALSPRLAETARIAAVILAHSKSQYRMYNAIVEACHLTGLVCDVCHGHKQLWREPTPERSAEYEAYEKQRLAETLSNARRLVIDSLDSLEKRRAALKVASRDERANIEDQIRWGEESLERHRERLADAETREPEPFAGEYIQCSACKGTGLAPEAVAHWRHVLFQGHYDHDD